LKFFFVQKSVKMATGCGRTRRRLLLLTDFDEFFSLADSILGPLEVAGPHDGVAGVAFVSEILSNGRNWNGFQESETGRTRFIEKLSRLREMPEHVLPVQKLESDQSVEI
jgi:hypothetical protein